MTVFIQKFDYCITVIFKIIISNTVIQNLVRTLPFLEVVMKEGFQNDKWVIKFEKPILSLPVNSLSV